MYLKDFMKLSLLLRFTRMVLMLLAYELKQDFWQNLPKVQIFHPQKN